MRTVTVSLVVRPDDFTTGRPVWPGDGTLRVISPGGVPVAKNDGYFVFTDDRPENIRVTSELYHNVTLTVAEGAGVLRVALIPRHTGNKRYYELGSGAYVAFSAARGGYTLTASTEAGVITLHKEDRVDLTDLWCVITTPDGAETPVTIYTAHGRGRYTLSETASFPLRSRLLPLYYVPEGQNLPVPVDARFLYLLRDGELEKIQL